MQAITKSSQGLAKFRERQQTQPSACQTTSGPSLSPDSWARRRMKIILNVPVTVRDGVALHYLDLGDGPPVFFHTGGGGDGTMWQSAGYLDALPGRRCVLFDHRGHGASGKPPHLAAHALEEYIADVMAVLDAEQIDRCAMIGYSDGARLMYSLAAHHPGRVSAIVGIGGVAHPDDDEPSSRRERADHVRTIGLPAWLHEAFDEEPEPAPPWFTDNLASTSTDMFALELEGWASSLDVSHDFPLIQAPTLIVCGALENTDGAAELAVKAIPDASAVVIPGFGHLQVFWRSDVTAPIVARFLVQHDPIASPAESASIEPGRADPF